MERLVAGNSHGFWCEGNLKWLAIQLLLNGVLARGWSLQKRQQLLEIQMLLSKSCPSIEAALKGGNFMGWCESEMSAWQDKIVAARKTAQEWHVNAIQNLLHQVPVAWCADAVEHDTSNVELGIVELKAPHKGCERLCLSSGVHDQDHREI